MAEFNNIPVGLKITTQLRLDAKEYSPSELALSNLGIDNQLAFTYYDGLKVFCQSERTTFEWREVLEGEEDTGLVVSDFIYPNGVTYPNGIYEGRRYNFFPSNIKTITSEDNSVRITESDISTDLSIDIVSSTINEGEGITVEGTGLSEDPYIITSKSPFQFYNDDYVEGQGIVRYGRIFDNYVEPGIDAIDFSVSTEPGREKGAPGDYSLAQGVNVIAAGENSVVFGDTNIANTNSLRSITQGFSNTNMSADSIVIGSSNLSRGSAKSTCIIGNGNDATLSGGAAIGIALRGSSIGTTIIGQANTNYTETPLTANVANQPLFIVGNGQVDISASQWFSVTLSDAFIVRFNGVVEAPSCEIADIDAGSNKTLVTKEYLESSSSAILPYKSYTALVSQHLTTNPIPVVLDNTTGATATWVRLATGQYTVSFTGSIESTHTPFVLCGSTTLTSSVAMSHIIFYQASNLTFETRNSSGTLTDGILESTPIEIRFYN